MFKTVHPKIAGENAVKGWAYLHYNYKFYKHTVLKDESVQWLHCRRKSYQNKTCGSELNWAYDLQRRKETFGSSVHCLLSPKTHWLLILNLRCCAVRHLLYTVGRFFSTFNWCQHKFGISSYQSTNQSSSQIMTNIVNASVSMSD